GTGTGGGVAVPTSGGSSGPAFRSTILAGNTATTASPDVARPATSPAVSQGSNVVGDGSGTPGFVDGANGDRVRGGTLPVLDARLGPLGANGGQTPTPMPLNASPAVDRGSNPDGLGTDQRGTGFPRVLGLATDAGAVESPYSPPRATAVLTDVTAVGPTH